MKSIKCQHCGFVNFVTQTHCKRCKNSLDNFSANASESSYQYKNVKINNSLPPPTFGEINQMQTKYKGFCLKCGNQENLTIQTFTKKYVSPVSVLGIFVGILPYFLLRLLLTTKHIISAPFCEQCWFNFKRARQFLLASHLGIFLSIFAGIISAMIFDSYSFLILIPALGVMFWVFSVIFEHLNSPKYKKIDDKKVIINSPKLGEICFEK